MSMQVSKRVQGQAAPPAKREPRVRQASRVKQASQVSEGYYVMMLLLRSSLAINMICSNRYLQSKCTNL